MKVLVCIMGVLVALAGGYCCAQPVFAETALSGMLVILIGVSMLIQGVGEIATWFSSRKNGGNSGLMLVSGVLSALFAVVLLCCNAFMVGMVTNVFLASLMALWLAVAGVIRVIGSLANRQLFQSLGRSWVASALIGVLLVVAGIGCFFAPTVLIAFMGIMLGAGMVIAGVSLVSLGLSIGGK
ncbi:MAG: DUF308 domain-containing protein [Coriobacteriia bacterium]|nr:DUF308 domain-containing protein [Coriobacteriia bacterium]